MLPQAMAPQLGLLCIGPLLMDQLYFEADSCELHYPGGNALIFSCVVSRMKVPIAIFGQVGWDARGEAVRGHLQSQGVDTRFLHSTRRHRTKVASVRVGVDGSWHKTAATPERFPYLPDPFLLPSLASWGHLHVGGLPGLLRSSAAATLKLVESCRQAGLSISMGLAPGGYDRGLLARVVEPTDLLLGNSDEFSQMLGQELNQLEEVPTILAGSAFQSWAVTLGPLGALGRWRGGPPVRVSVPPGCAVSTVGAGDVFSGVLVSALHLGKPIEVALELACCAATLSVGDRTWDGWMAKFAGLTELGEYVVTEWSAVTEV